MVVALLFALLGCAQNLILIGFPQVGLALFYSHHYPIPQKLFFKLFWGDILGIEF